MTASPSFFGPFVEQVRARLRDTHHIERVGRVAQVTGLVIESDGPSVGIGEVCKIGLHGAAHGCYAEVVGFRDHRVLLMPLGELHDVSAGCDVVASSYQSSVPVGPRLIGRVIDGLGQPLDNRGPLGANFAKSLRNSPPNPLRRVRIHETFETGIKVLDLFTPIGRGQRIGIFGGSGVGKSTLLGMMARGTGADMTVLALVGERGREVGEFLEVIGDEGRRRSVVVVSTSDQSPLLRLRAALSATAIAEYFASTGKNVLLVVDSLTRFAMAQREIGLSAGEPPTAKGYTPSVLNMLARLVERAGCFKSGSITAFYTVLMEGDDQQDPVADTVRSLLDGHVILDRNLAMRNHYPPISMLESLSRLMPSITSEEHMQKAKALRLLLASYNRSEDLIRIGAYQKGSDPTLDRAVEILPQLNTFLQQRPEQIIPFATVVKSLLELPS